jgi:hypothetical protein
MKLVLLTLLFWLPLAEARIDAFPSHISFFNVEVGDFLGQQRSVTVYNRNDEDARITVTDYCFGDFRITNWCFGTLRPGGSCHIDVRFQPSRVGYQSCTVWLRDNLGGSESVSISGQGVDRN